MPILHQTSFIANRKDDDGQPRGPKGKRMSLSVIIMTFHVYSLCKHIAIVCISVCMCHIYYSL